MQFCDLRLRWGWKRWWIGLGNAVGLAAAVPTITQPPFWAWSPLKDQCRLVATSGVSNVAHVWQVGHMIWAPLEEGFLYELRWTWSGVGCPPQPLRSEGTMSQDVVVSSPCELSLGKLLVPVISLMQDTLIPDFWGLLWGKGTNVRLTWWKKFDRNYFGATASLHEKLRWIRLLHWIHKLQFTGDSPDPYLVCFRKLLLQYS